jgi:hypothetical protein
VTGRGTWELQACAIQTAPTNTKEILKLRLATASLCRLQAYFGTLLDELTRQRKAPDIDREASSTRAEYSPRGNSSRSMRARSCRISCIEIADVIANELR